MPCDYFFSLPGQQLSHWCVWCVLSTFASPSVSPLYCTRSQNNLTLLKGPKKKNSLNKFHKHHFCLVSNYFCGRFEKNQVTQRNPERCSLFKHICTGTVSAYFLHICSIFNIWTFINSLLQNAKLSEGRFSYIRSTLCSTYVTNVINTLKHTQ